MKTYNFTIKSGMCKSYITCTATFEVHGKL